MEEAPAWVDDDLIDGELRRDDTPHRRLDVHPDGDDVGGLTLTGCFANTAGWANSGSNPSCGSGGTWYTDCDWNWGAFSCSSAAGNVARTQECR